MKVSLTVLPSSKEQALDILEFLNGLENGDDSDGDDDTDEAPVKKAPKKAKKKVIDDDDVDNAEEDDDSDTDDADEEPKVTKKQLIAAFKEYASENSREEAGKILKKLKVKSVNDIDPDDYPKALKMVGG